MTMSYNLLESQIKVFLKTASEQPREHTGDICGERLDELGERE